MDANLERATSILTGDTRFHDLDVVRLTEDVRADGGLFPRGSCGTIVFVYGGARAYEVEFDAPQADVVTVREDQLAAG
jgi:hypothetical protein